MTGFFLQKNKKKCSKTLQCKKLYIYLHCQTKTKGIMKALKFTSAEINHNFRIKVHGRVDGKKINKLVGVSVLLDLIGIDRVNKFVTRAFASMDDKCACKIYNGACVTFYYK